MPRAQTIQIFLPTGDPQGIRIASLPTRTVRVLEVPRSLVPELLQRPEAAQVAVYFLVGGEETSGSAYIGQTSDLATRLRHHVQERDFWERVFVVVSLTGEWTQTHSLYLEWACIQQARDAGRFTLLNGTTGSRPHTPEPLEADCEEFLETTRLLTSTLSLPLLEPVKRGRAQVHDDGVAVTLSRSECSARGVYSSEGLLVLRGSVGRFIDRSGSEDHTTRLADRLRALQDEGIVRVTGESTEFLRDHLYATPSGAAADVLCSNANGRTEWRDGRGRTIAALEDAALANTT